MPSNNLLTSDRFKFNLGKLWTVNKHWKTSKPDLNRKKTRRFFSKTTLHVMPHQTFPWLPNEALILHRDRNLLSWIRKVGGVVRQLERPARKCAYTLLYCFQFTFMSSAATFTRYFVTCEVIRELTSDGLLYRCTLFKITAWRMYIKLSTSFS